MNEIKTSRSTIAKVDRNADGAQILVLPEGFELDAAEVDIATDGDKLIISPHAAAPQAPKSWSEFLDKLEPVDVDWPDVDEGLLPADDVDLLK